MLYYIVTKIQTPVGLKVHNFIKKVKKNDFWCKNHLKYMYINEITIPVFKVTITFQKCWKSFFFDPVNTLFTIETLLEDK